MFIVDNSHPCCLKCYGRLTWEELLIKMKIKSHIINGTIRAYEQVKLA